MEPIVWETHDYDKELPDLSDAERDIVRSYDAQGARLEPEGKTRVNLTESDIVVAEPGLQVARMESRDDLIQLLRSQKLTQSGLNEKQIVPAKIAEFASFVRQQGFSRLKDDARVTDSHQLILPEAALEKILACMVYEGENNDTISSPRRELLIEIVDDSDRHSFALFNAETGQLIRKDGRVDVEQLLPEIILISSQQSELCRQLAETRLQSLHAV
ncbi:hypothetical protein A2307_03695 [Candidatus Peregrinibacteria bacterium RIFOXYB2_FULL_33_20]|nr:MAG: hypothetical protein A2307_03695 [Candidatus Peregrinibacteria bacterium RIFOXYB2_FULL_33_20]